MLKIIVIIGIIYAIYQGYKIFAARQEQEKQRQQDIARNATAVREIMSDIETASHAAVDSIDAVMDVYNQSSSYMVQLTFYFHRKDLVYLHNRMIAQFNDIIHSGNEKDTSWRSFSQKLLLALFPNGNIPNNYPTFTEFKTNEDSLFASFYRGNAKNFTLENTLIIMDSAAEQARKQYPNIRIIVNKDH